MRKKSAYSGSDGEKALNYAKSCFYGIIQHKGYVRTESLSSGQHRNRF